MVRAIQFIKEFRLIQLTVVIEYNAINYGLKEISSFGGRKPVFYYTEINYAAQCYVRIDNVHWESFPNRLEKLFLLFRLE